MIAEKWDISREDDGGVRAREPRAGDPRAGGGPLRPRDRPAARGRGRRGPASWHVAREDGARCRTLVEGGRLTAAVSSQISDAAHRDARDVGAGGEGPRRHAAGPHPPPVGARRRPDLHAHRADPGDRVRAREDGHVARRHRPRRDQRGVRLGRARVAEGDRRRPRRRSTSTAARSRSATRSARPACG